jgi:hypothetical protein
MHESEVLRRNPPGLSTRDSRGRARRAYGEDLPGARALPRARNFTCFANQEQFPNELYLGLKVGVYTRGNASFP